MTKWLEWINYNIIIDDNPTDIIIVQGTQQDEVMEGFIVYKMMLLFSILILAIGILINSLYRVNDTKGTYGRRAGDCD